MSRRTLSSLLKTAEINLISCSETTKCNHKVHNSIVFDSTASLSNNTPSSRIFYTKL